ncbi:hypothetical protein Tco_1133753 [Tanacetum coccineum]
MSDTRARERSDPLRPSRIALSIIMDVSGSPDRVSDLPNGETPWTYGGLAPGPPLGYTGNPSGSAPLVEEIVGPTEPMYAPTIDGDKDMEPLFSTSEGEFNPDLYTLDDDDIAIEIILEDSDMDDSAMHMDPVVAPVFPSLVMTTPPPLVAIPEPSVHEVGGSSTATDMRPPSIVEELDAHIDDVGFRHDVLVTRVDTVRDAVTAIGAVIGEIGQRVIALEGHT